MYKNTGTMYKYASRGLSRVERVGDLRDYGGVVALSDDEGKSAGAKARIFQGR
jgi:hypothetical protein